MTRLTVVISDSKDLYQFSNPNNALKSYDIIAVEPMNEKMFELACNDINADIVSLNFEEKINFVLKKTQILSAIERNVFFEIRYSEFIRDTTKRSTFISNVMLLLDVTKGKNVILSSGSESFYYHRSPYDVMTMFETIFEIKKDTVLNMLTKNSEKVILKSLQRKYFKTVMEIVDNPKEITKTDMEYDN